MTNIDKQIDEAHIMIEESLHEILALRRDAAATKWSKCNTKAHTNNSETQAIDPDGP